MIACVRLPHFGAAIEQRDRPALAGMPLALLDEAGRVYGASRQAVRAGIVPGMSARQAQALCAGLHLLPAAPARYRQEFHRLLAALTHFTAYVEAEDSLELRADARQRASVACLPPAQVDEHPAATCYLDLGPLPDGNAPRLAGEVGRAVERHSGLTAAVGLAGGRFPARVAALSLAPGEVLAVPGGREADFLARFTVSLLPVDGETIRQLHLLGLVTLGQIAALPVAAVVDRFGQVGRVMHRLASGRDSRPVQRYAPPHIEEVAHVFDAPVDDWLVLHAVLERLADSLGERLRQAGQAARHVVLAIRLDDGTRVERALALRQPRARLVESARDLATGLALPCGVTGVALTVDDIGAPPARQLSLFEREPVSAVQLRGVLESLAARYGADWFYWVRVADGEARLPERRIRLEKVGGR